MCDAQSHARIHGAGVMRRRAGGGGAVLRSRLPPSGMIEMTRRMKERTPLVLSSPPTFDDGAAGAAAAVAGTVPAAAKKAGAAGDEAVKLVEDVCAATIRGAGALGGKLIDVMRENTVAGFDFATGMLGAGSLGQAVELQAAFARRRVESIASQSREIADLARRTAYDSVAPYRELAERFTPRT